MRQLDLLWSDTSLLEEKEGFEDALSDEVASEDDAAETDRVVEPVLNQVEEILGNVLLVGTLEGSFVGVVHGFEDGVESLVGNAKIEEEVNDPSSRADTTLVFQGIALEHG